MRDTFRADRGPFRAIVLLLDRFSPRQVSCRALRISAIFTNFIKFASVGALATTLQYVILISLVELALAGPVTASAIGFILSANVNYILNYYLTFASKAAHRVAGPKFFIIALIGLILNSTILFAMVNGMMLHYVVGQVIATGLVLVWSFLANKYWTFKSRNAT